MTPLRWAALAVGVLMLFFAVQGGEYSTTNLLTIRRQEREEAQRVKELQRTVDSLDRRAKAIETDPRVQERLAREQFGMIRAGEHLFRIVPPGEQK